MSIDIMNWVWKNSTTKGTERLVLLSLADQANDQGVCWPSLAGIARRANVSRRRAIDAISYLEENGYILVSRRSDGKEFLSSYYTVLMVNPIPAARLEGSEDMDTTGGSEQEDTTPSEQGITTPSEHGITRVVKPSSLKPPVNHHIEPPVKPPKGRGKKEPRAPETNHLPIASAIAKVTNVSLNLNKAQIFAEAKRLHKEGITAEQIERDYGAGGIWYQFDWRGIKGQPPTISQIRQTWGNIKPSANGNGNGNSSNGTKPVETLAESARRIVEERKAARGERQD